MLSSGYVWMRGCLSSGSKSPSNLSFPSGLRQEPSFQFYRGASPAGTLFSRLFRGRGREGWICASSDFILKSPFLWEVIGSPYFQDLHLHSQWCLRHPGLGPEYVRQTPVKRQARFISIDDFEVLNLWQAQVCSMCKTRLYSEQWGAVLCTFPRPLSPFQ